MTEIQRPGPMWTIDDSEWDAPPCTADCPCPLCVWNSEREAELLAVRRVADEPVRLVELPAA